MNFNLKRRAYERLPVALKRVIGLVPFAWLAGPAYRRRMRRVAWLDRASRAELRAFQDAELKRTLEFAADQVPAYQRLRSTVSRLGGFEALKAFPAVNAEIQGDEIVYKHYYDIGVAVGTERGLVVPVVRDAERRSFIEIEQQIAELARKARENKLSMDELTGGTFTITNGGIYGSMLSTPILNPPQVGILGMHNIVKRAVVQGDAVVVRPMMYLALSYDHRLVDGREAVQFLVRVKDCIEDPARILLEI